METADSHGALGAPLLLARQLMVDIVPLERVVTADTATDHAHTTHQQVADALTADMGAEADDVKK
jgi:hypothetical protein